MLRTSSSPRLIPTTYFNLYFSSRLQIFRVLSFLFAPDPLSLVGTSLSTLSISTFRGVVGWSVVLDGCLTLMLKSLSS